ncbi:MAG: hypothetical protein HRU11_14030, partial [Parvularculaceae bacterium]|nr:hypothetical protein [Parvularculaceae bacterium]
LVDTGSNSGFSLNDLERFRLSSGPVRSGVSTRLNRLEKRYTARIDGPIEAGPLTFEEPVVASTPKNELMGGEVLRYAKLTYDAEKRRVAFEPYDSAPVPAPAPPLRDGLMMKPAGDNFEVTGIIPGFEDNVADIVVGDTVIAINGRPITDRGCRVMDAERPTSRTLTIQRGDDIMERTLNFKPLLD